MVSMEVNQRLTKIFGLDGQRIRSLTLHAAVGEPTTLTTTRLLLEPGDVREVTRVFSLVLAESGDPCEIAMLAVQAVIEAAAARARAKLQTDHIHSVRRICGFADGGTIDTYTIPFSLRTR